MNSRARAVEIALHQIASAFEQEKKLWNSFRLGKHHSVFMSFVRQVDGWHCRFHEGNPAKTPLSKQFVFRSQERILETAHRGHGLTSPESRQVFDEAIFLGRGGIWLKLTEEQYQTLRHQS